MNLEILSEDKAIEKGSTKRKLSEKQLENLAKGRAVRAKMKEDRLASAPALEKQIEPKPSIVAEPKPEPVPRRKRNKQVIVFDDNSESETEAPQIIIKQKRTQKALAPTAPPSPPPSPPPPIPRLRRV